MWGAACCALARLRFAIPAFLPEERRVIRRSSTLSARAVCGCVIEKGALWWEPPILVLSNEGHAGERRAFRAAKEDWVRSPALAVDLFVRFVPFSSAAQQLFYAAGAGSLIARGFRRCKSIGPFVASLPSLACKPPARMLACFVYLFGRSDAAQMASCEGTSLGACSAGVSPAIS